MTDAIINKTYDPSVFLGLNDESFLARCGDSASTARNLAILDKILTNCRIRKAIREKICQNATPLLIPPGVKAALRGNQLNKVVNERLARLVRKRRDLTILFEQTHKKFSALIHERPDWVIIDATGKIIVGFTQVSLWGGGQQLNRAAKYVLDESLHRALARKGVRLVCVVAEKPTSLTTEMTKTSKLYKILERGIKTNRIVYPGGLAGIIPLAARVP
jgi:hypothetical protein